MSDLTTPEVTVENDPFLRIRQLIERDRKANHFILVTILTEKVISAWKIDREKIHTGEMSDGLFHMLKSKHEAEKDKIPCGFVEMSRVEMLDISYAWQQDKAKNYGRYGLAIQSMQRG